MGLLKRSQRPRKSLPPYITLRCVVAGHQVTWCKGLCEPLNGRGACGRLAPHSLKSTHQLAIAAFKQREAEQKAA
jgi:hypothetical protein